MNVQKTQAGRSSFSLRALQPQLQVLVMLGFALLIIAALAITGFIVPEVVQSAVSRP